MRYNVVFSKTALKQLKKMDNYTKLMLVNWIEKNLGKRIYGKALKGNLKNQWRYRVGDYRILCNIEDDKLIILVINVGHRREIYK
ncbi:type II toxin-antitoxin system RelE family toxin [Thomasclavelia cocleata]|uniref:mRNA interferase RelE/StbE n=1 Tax=Thomasclavelia cocleata TaxID=69824 RepID=A0A1I0DTM6_9FIRM|nr:type II toxin-antitoxin system RelE/ParE family toxin [Thomasclavelia cocleata]MCR1960031.1 type II toxin-antitoxin system RelE/ParE family toxin [Thomasclavelia cocleata]SET35163.1 mRNA interferase RelE/StbE [Thomasclavelia cocleata]